MDRRDLLRLGIAESFFDGVFSGTWLRQIEPVGSVGWKRF